MTAQRQEVRGWGGRIATIVLFASLFCIFGAQAGTSERVVTGRYSGLAIGGVDPVAYFTDARPMPGLAGVESSAAGAVWRFRNEGNRLSFLARPDVYSPQFGGYDPVGVAHGVAFSGNPQVWLIVGQRLYLFGREDNRDAFAAAPQRFLPDAAQHWPTVQDKLAQ